MYAGGHEPEGLVSARCFVWGMIGWGRERVKEKVRMSWDEGTCFDMEMMV